jgi:hypothetical protein
VGTQGSSSPNSLWSLVSASEANAAERQKPRRPALSAPCSQPPLFMALPRRVLPASPTITPTRCYKMRMIDRHGSLNRAVSRLLPLSWWYHHAVPLRDPGLPSIGLVSAPSWLPCGGGGASPSTPCFNLKALHSSHIEHPQTRERVFCQQKKIATRILQRSIASTTHHRIFD